MEWETKRHYPVDVTTKVMVKPLRARRHAGGPPRTDTAKAPPGAFLAWAGDVFLAMEDVYYKQVDRHLDECNRRRGRAYEDGVVHRPHHGAAVCVLEAAADAEGHRSVGSWIAEALDRHLDALQRAGKPLPLAGSWDCFHVRLEDGTEPELRGWIARPFGFFRGSAAGPLYMGCHRYTLVYLPTRRIVGTFRRAAHCKALGAELARPWIRWGGSEPAEDPASLL